jgi:hypothetical protein
MPLVLKPFFSWYTPSSMKARLTSWSKAAAISTTSSDSSA